MVPFSSQDSFLGSAESISAFPYEEAPNLNIHVQEYHVGLSSDRLSRVRASILHEHCEKDPSLEAYWLSTELCRAYSSRSNPNARKPFTATARIIMD